MIDVPEGAPKSAENPPKVVGRPFQKGADPRRVGNGRKPGLEKLIREKTGDGLELVEGFLAFWRNTDIAPKERMRAGVWLAERGFGKVAQPVDGDGDGGPIRLQIVAKLAAVLDADVTVEDVTP